MSAPAVPVAASSGAASAPAALAGTAVAFAFLHKPEGIVRTGERVSLPC